MLALPGSRSALAAAGTHEAIRTAGLLMRNLKMTLAYDGTEFCGWQVQPNQITVQGTVQTVLAEIDGVPVTAHGSGRTDAGVHALGQAASFNLSNPIPVENLSRAMNHLLPDAIRVLKVEEAAPDFHARRSALAKTYEYRIWREDICAPFLSRYVCPHPYPLDEDAMTEAASLFAGTHDFCSLAAAGGEEKQTTVRHDLLFAVTPGRRLPDLSGSRQRLPLSHGPQYGGNPA